MWMKVWANVETREIWPDAAAAVGQGCLLIEEEEERSCTVLLPLGEAGGREQDSGLPRVRVFMTPEAWKPRE